MFQPSTAPVITSAQEDMLLPCDLPGTGHKKMLLNARQIFGEADAPQLILLAMEDITRTGVPGEVRKSGTRDRKVR